MEKLFILLSIHLLALATPGPDFMIMLRCSLSGKIRKTLLCCLGISSGVATHLLMAYLGLSLILSQSKILYSLIVILGCLWLVNIAISGLRSNGSNFSHANLISYSSNISAFRAGYLTNLLNPKVLIYFVSVIYPLVRPEEGNLYFIVGLSLTVMTFLWFSSLAIFLNTKGVKKVFENYSKYIDRFFSIVILILAFYMLYGELAPLLKQS